MIACYSIDKDLSHVKGPGMRLTDSFFCSGPKLMDHPLIIHAWLQFKCSPAAALHVHCTSFQSTSHSFLLAFFCVNFSQGWTVVATLYRLQSKARPTTA